MNEKSVLEEGNVISMQLFQKASAHFRPCGVEEEFLDDPLAELLNEFADDPPELTEDPPPFWSEQYQESLEIKDILEEALQSMSPIQKLRFSMMKTKKSLKELHYYNRELKTFLGV